MDARAPADGHQQAVAAQLVAFGELEHELAVLPPHRGGGLLTEAELHAVGGPPPSTSSRSGTSARPVTSRFVQTPSSSGRPGIGGRMGSDPVAITMWSQE